MGCSLSLASGLIQQIEAFGFDRGIEAAIKGDIIKNRAISTTDNLGNSRLVLVQAC